MYVKRAQKERLRSAVETLATDEFLNVHALGKQLFFDPCGHPSMYALGPGYWSNKQTSWNGQAVDPLDPLVLRTKLESSSAGCRWLLGQWSELRDRLAPGSFWQSPDRLKCIRLLAHQPLDSATDRVIAEIQAASFAIHPQRRSSAWQDLLCEMGSSDLKRYRRRVRERFPDLIPHLDADRARKFLIDLVDREINRLNEKVAEHEKDPRATAEQTVARLRVDQTPEGDRLHRFESKCISEFRRSIDMYRKIRGIRNSKAKDLAADAMDDSDLVPDDSTVPAAEQRDQLARAVERNGSPAKGASSPASPTPGPVRPASNPQSQPAANPLRGLSKREKRRQRREMEEHELKRRLAEGREKMNAHMAPMNESIKALLTQSPEAIDSHRVVPPGLRRSKRPPLRPNRVPPIDPKGCHHITLCSRHSPCAVPPPFSERPEGSTP